MTTPIRPISLIADELADAEAMAEATRDVARDDPLIVSMLDSNDRDVQRLRDELRDARSSDVELSIEGRPVVSHRISASYLSRMINDVQSAYRAVADGITDGTELSRAQTSLTVAGTAPGSFRVMFRTAEEPLSLLDRPVSEQALETLFSILDTATGSNRVDLRGWASNASEASVRSMIRLAATLASSNGTTQLRWTPPGGTDRVTALPADAARFIATELAGAVGREIITVQGHLGMAQDDPPRVRVSTPTDDHVAAVRDDSLLDLVRDLLFQDVSAEIAVDMATSPTTGAPSTRSELLSLRPANETSG